MIAPPETWLKVANLMNENQEETETVKPPSETDPKKVGRITYRRSKSEAPGLKKKKEKPIDTKSTARRKKRIEREITKSKFRNPMIGDWSLKERK